MFTFRSSPPVEKPMPVATVTVVSKEKTTDDSKKTKLVALPSVVPTTLTPVITFDNSTLKEKVRTDKILIKIYFSQISSTNICLSESVE